MARPKESPIPDLALLLPLPALPFPLPLSLGSGCVSRSGFGRLLGFEVELISICSMPGNKWPNTACSSDTINEMAGETSLKDYKIGRRVSTCPFDLLITEQASSLLNSNKLFTLWKDCCLLNLYLRMLTPNHFLCGLTGNAFQHAAAHTYLLPAADTTNP